VHSRPAAPSTGASNRHIKTTPTRRYHSLVVDPATLPPELVPLAWTCAGHHAVMLQRDADTAAAAAAAAAATAAAAAAGTADTAAAAAAAALPGQVEHSDCSSATQITAAAAAATESASILMALAHASRPHYGVQFHPESVATRFGVQLLANFRDLVAAHHRRPRPPPVADGVGPPGRCLPPRAWPAAAPGCGASNDHPQQQQQQQQRQRRSRRSSGWDDEALSSGAEPQAAASASVKLGPGTAATRLQLQWCKLEGVLDAIGGSQVLFEALAGPNGGEDVFWLDR